MFETDYIAADVYRGIATLLLFFPIAPLALCVTAGWLAGHRSNLPRGRRIGTIAGLGVGIFPIILAAFWIYFLLSAPLPISATTKYVAIFASYPIIGVVTYLTVSRILSMRRNN